MYRKLDRRRDPTARRTKGRETWAEIQDVLQEHLIAQGVVPGAQPASGNQPASKPN
jgi:hypothetical protein